MASSIFLFGLYFLLYTICIQNIADNLKSKKADAYSVNFDWRKTLNKNTGEN